MNIEMTQIEGRDTTTPAWFTRAADAIHTFQKEMDVSEIEGELPELFAGFALSAPVFAQILMQAIPLQGMSVAQKHFWIEVNAYIGPDWLAALRRAVAFMSKTDEF